MIKHKVSRWEAKLCQPAGSSKSLCYGCLPYVLLYVYHSSAVICWIVSEYYQGSLPLHPLDVASFHR